MTTYLIEFRTAKLRRLPEQLNESNPHLKGYALAVLLSAELAKRGAYEVGQVFGEDWGWGFRLTDGASKWMVACGAEATSDTHDECHVAVSRRHSLWVEVTGRTTSPEGALTSDILKVCLAEPEFENARASLEQR